VPVARKTLENVGYGKGGLELPGDGRPFTAQNYHCTEKGVNLSLTLRRPAPGTTDTLECLSCPVAHSFAGRLTQEGRPVVLVLSDQAFPAMLPAREGDCVIIVRVEDGTLAEIEMAFAERLGAYLRPHGSLSSGSLILIGSLSHLKTRGLSDYAESLVRVVSSLSSRAGLGVDVAPLVVLPLHGVEEDFQVRALLDLDSWILSGNNGVSAFPKTRAAFWETTIGGLRGGLPWRGGARNRRDGGRYRRLCHHASNVLEKPEKGTVPLSAPYRFGQAENRPHDRNSGEKNSRLSSARN